MKFAHSFAALLVLLPLFAQASPLQDFHNGVRAGQGQFKPVQPKTPAFPAKGGNQAQNQQQQNQQNQQQQQQQKQQQQQQAQQNQNQNQNQQNKGGNNAANQDPQSSLTLLNSVIATGFQNNGQDQPTAGQVASITSSNNFINFCATVPQLKITNGLQIKEGSCNPAPMGVIPSTGNMPSSKFVFPKNGQTIAANQDFTIQMAIQHLSTGFFTNPNENYFAAPQTVDGSGNIVGHSHVVVEKLQSLDQTTPNDPNQFAFFKGLNDKAANGVLSAAVTGGLPAGVYKLSSINSAANHQPVLVAVAQHGSLDDAIYFTVAAQGAAPASSASSAAAAPSVGAIRGANTGNNGNQAGFIGNKGQNQNNQNQNQNKGQNNKGAAAPKATTGPAKSPFKGGVKQ